MFNNDHDTKYGSSDKYGGGGSHLEDQSSRVFTYDDNSSKSSAVSSTRFLIFLILFTICSVLFSSSFEVRVDLEKSTIPGTLNSKQGSFNEFIWEHDKSYINDDEKNTRYEIFSENLEEIERRNDEERRVGGMAIHGVNMFTDMTEDEILQGYLTIQLPDYDASRLSDAPLRNPIPSKVYANWIGEYTATINSQGRCGACWAFTAVEQIEADVIRTVRPLGFNPVNLKLSIQNLVDCVYLGKSSGCRGGWISTAYKFAINEGIERNSTYPYTAKNNSECVSDTAKYVVKLQNYTEVWQNETWMMLHVLSTGPLSVAINARHVYTYKSGVMQNCGPDGSVTHGVQVVGINLNAVVPYWIVRNSWGTKWGDNGYLYLEYGRNLCNISYYSSFTDPLLYLPAEEDFINDDHPLLPILPFVFS